MFIISNGSRLHKLLNHQQTKLKPQEKVQLETNSRLIVMMSSSIEVRRQEGSLAEEIKNLAPHINSPVVS